MLIKEILNRRSVRDYLERSVEKEKLARILEAARLAPTARNQQDWSILVVDDPTIKNELVEQSSPHQPFLKQASAILVGCALNPGYVMRCGHPAFLIDLAIVLDHISLQAVREGLGTCWIGSFQQDKAKAVLHIPEEVQIVELMALGYPKEKTPARKRKSFSELFKWNQW